MVAHLVHHEALYRGEEVIGQRTALRVTVCGVGAIGSHLVDNLVRQGFRTIRVIDRDRVEEHNAGTQTYGLADVGQLKVTALQHQVYAATGVELDSQHKDVNQGNVRQLLKGSALVVDALDNSASRALVQANCRNNNLPCVHLGLYEGYGQVVWDRCYRVPRDPVGGDTCDYPLARNIILLTVAVASEAIAAFFQDQCEACYEITLRDLKVSGPLALPAV